MKKIFMPCWMFSALFLSFGCEDKVPDCTRKEAWPASVAYTKLKNAGLIASTDHLPNNIPAKNMHVRRLASEALGKGLYKQLHWVQFEAKDKVNISVIVANTASNEECSVEGGDVYLIEKKL